MNILILGGNGFIGSNLGDFLSMNGYHVISFDIVIPANTNKNIHYVKGDFFDETDIIPYLKESDVVFHAISTINPGNSNIKYMHAYSCDFLQSVKLAQFSKEYNFKLIYLSSGGTVYGRQEKMPINEKTLSIPINHYGNIKLCIENTYRTFNKQLKTDIKIARIANPYGPGQDYLKGVGFIDAVLKRAISHDVIEVYGHGNIVRDYIYIDDVCKMLEKMIIYNGEEEVFNLGTGIGVSQNEIIDIVKSIFPDMQVVYLPERAIDVPCIILDNTLIMELFDAKCVEVGRGILSYYNHIIKEK